jgi:hypothetical protein
VKPSTRTTIATHARSSVTVPRRSSGITHSAPETFPATSQPGGSSPASSLASPAAARPAVGTAGRSRRTGVFAVWAAVGDTAAATGAIRHPRGVTRAFDSRLRSTTGVKGRVAAVGIRRRRRRRGAWGGVWDVKHGRIRRLGALRVVRGRIRRRSRRIRRAGTRTAVITRAIRSELLPVVGAVLDGAQEGPDDKSGGR